MRSAKGASVSPEVASTIARTRMRSASLAGPGGAARQADDGSGGDLGLRGHRLVAVVRGDEAEEEQEAGGQYAADR